jgi:cyanophycinase
MSGRLADNTRPRTGPGLGLVPGVIIDMHFAQRGRLPRLVAAVRGHPGHLGIGIDEDTAILIGSSRFDVLGRGAAVTVDVRPGSAIRQHTLRGRRLRPRAKTTTRTGRGN